MGGFGSGDKWDKKGTVESHQCLDVRRLDKEHGINPGSEMTIKFQWRGEEVVQQVSLDWTPCNYGGYRPWFICMHCGRRVAVLYLRIKFACRHCHNLTYTSCQEADSRLSKLFRNYDVSSGVENMPLCALKRCLSRSWKEKKRIIKALNRRRRGRPPKIADGPQGNLH